MGARADGKGRMREVNPDIEYDWAARDARIREHYDHAREKHPYFCDCISLYNPGVVKMRLKQLREDLDYHKSVGCVSMEMLARCELIEIEEAYWQGDTAQAVEECYDAISVLLRTIDVLEGRQKLGRNIPNEHKNN